MDFEIVCGTTKNVVLTIFNADGSIYELQSGDKIIFGVKEKCDKLNNEYLIKKTADSSKKSGDGYLISFYPEDTKDIPFGNYEYDAGIQTSDGDYYMVIEASIFRIKKAITAKE